MPKNRLDQYSVSYLSDLVWGRALTLKQETPSASQSQILGREQELVHLWKTAPADVNKLITEAVTAVDATEWILSKVSEAFPKGSTVQVKGSSHLRGTVEGISYEGGRVLVKVRYLTHAMGLRSSSCFPPDDLELIKETLAAKVLGSLEDKPGKGKR